MAEGGQDGLQILADGLGTAGEIDDQGPVPNPGDRPGEHGPGRDGQGGLHYSTNMLYSKSLGSNSLGIVLSSMTLI